MTNSIRIYIADDHPVYRQGLRRAFEDAGGFQYCGAAADGATALAEILADPPDVAILDISMPGMSGLEITAALCDEGTPTKVILLTGSEELKVIHAALLVGVAGYLLKTASWESLIDATRRVQNGETVIATEVMGALAAQIQIVKSEEERLAKCPLTPRELEILTLASKGYSAVEISQELRIEAATIKSHRHSTLVKLGERNQAGAVGQALRRGLIL